MNVRNLMILVLASASIAQGADQGTVNKDPKEKKETPKKEEEKKPSQVGEASLAAKARILNRSNRTMLRRNSSLSLDKFKQLQEALVTQRPALKNQSEPEFYAKDEEEDQE